MDDNFSEKGHRSCFNDTVSSSDTNLICFSTVIHVVEILFIFKSHPLMPVALSISTSASVWIILPSHLNPNSTPSAIVLPVSSQIVHGTMELNKLLVFPNYSKMLLLIATNLWASKLPLRTHNICFPWMTSFKLLPQWKQLLQTFQSCLVGVILQIQWLSKELQNPR